MIIKIIRKNKIIKTELVLFHDTLPLDIPRSIGQLIFVLFSNLHLYCNQTKWKADVWLDFGIKKRKSDSTIVDGVAVCSICKVQPKTVIAHLRRQHQ